MFGGVTAVATRPRPITTARILAVTAVLALALAGCADSSRPAPPGSRPYVPENPTRPASPETWLGEVCVALLPAVRGGTPVPEVTPGDPVGSRNRMAAFLSARAEAFTRAADEINAAGPAPVEGGQSVTEDVVRVLRDRAATAAADVAMLRAIPETAGDTLVDAVQEVRNRIPLAGPSVSLVDLALPPTLMEAAARVPSCVAASRPG